MSGAGQRILIIGISGGGKSWLAARLAETLSLPLIHLDRHYWLPGWKQPSREAWREKAATLAAGENWVMDGNYAGTFDIRMPRATRIVWLDRRPLGSILRVAGRVLRHWGKARPDMGPDCPERLDLEFFRYIWNFNLIVKPEIEAALRRFAPSTPLHVVRRKREARTVIAGLGARAEAWR